MAKKKIKLELTKDHLLLISNIRHIKVENLKSATSKDVKAYIDMFSIYGGNYLLEDISYILGIYDKHIPDTENGIMGVRFDQELEDYMFSLNEYIVNNIDDIEDLVHQFSINGGLTEGTYQCEKYIKIWEKVD